MFCAYRHALHDNTTMLVAPHHVLPGQSTRCQDKQRKASPGSASSELLGYTRKPASYAEIASQCSRKHLCAMSPNPSTTVILVPLDDRPCCLQFVKRLAALRRIEVLTPPRHLLGDLRHPGHCLGLWRWLDKQPGGLPAILSVDMLMFGGLVNSRRCSYAGWENSVSWQRLQRLCQRPNTYLFSTITRLAPTQFHPSEAEHHARVVEDLVTLGQSFVDNASLIAASTSQNFVKIHAQLRLHTPLQELSEILARRREKFNLHRKLIELVQTSDANTFLLLGLDDSKTHGVNILESDDLQVLCRKSPQTLVSTGADELAQLLLARLVAPQQDIAVVWSDENWRKQITSYEDCPLSDVIERQLRVVGSPSYTSESETARKALCVWCPARIKQTEACHQDADSFLSSLAPSDEAHITTKANKRASELSRWAKKQAIRANDTVGFRQSPQHKATLKPQQEFSTQSTQNQSEENPRRAQCYAFVQKIANLLDQSYQVSVADVAYSNGCDAMLSAILLQEGVFFRLSGFAGWNTAANTTGTALTALLLAPQGSQSAEKRAMLRLLTERLADDMLYQSLLRQRIAALGNRATSSPRSITHWTGLEQILTAWIRDSLHRWFNASAREQGAPLTNRKAKLPLGSDMPKLGIPTIKVTLPWHRFFEIEANATWSDAATSCHNVRKAGSLSTARRKLPRHRKRK